MPAQVSSVADGARGLVIGKVAGSAFPLRESGRTAENAGLWARSCVPLWIGRDPIA